MAKEQDPQKLRKDFADGKIAISIDNSTIEEIKELEKNFISENINFDQSLVSYFTWVKNKTWEYLFINEFSNLDACSYRYIERHPYLHIYPANVLLSIVNIKDINPTEIESVLFGSGEYK